MWRGRAKAEINGLVRCFYEKYISETLLPELGWSGMQREGTQLVKQSRNINFLC
jgi:hypothetical protein